MYLNCFPQYFTFIIFHLLCFPRIDFIKNMCSTEFHTKLYPKVKMNMLKEYLLHLGYVTYCSCHILQIILILNSTFSFGVFKLFFIILYIYHYCSRQQIWVGCWRWILGQSFNTTALKCLKITMRGSSICWQDSSDQVSESIKIWV